MMKRIRLVILFLVSAVGFSYGQDFMQLSVDGPGLDSHYGLDKTIRLGTLSHLGLPGVGGDFPARQSRVLGGDIDSDAFKAVLYEFSPLTGGNNEYSHPNTSLAVKVNSPVNWQLCVSARVIGDPSVTVDQLLFKPDEQREYTPFTPAPQVIARGSQGIYHLFYDLALRIDPEDKPGHYFVQINFDLVAF